MTTRAGLAFFLTLFTTLTFAERIAHDDPRIQYTPQEEWRTSADEIVPSFLRSSLSAASHFTWTNGAVAAVNFTGIGVQLIGTLTNVSAQVLVTLDGVGTNIVVSPSARKRHHITPRQVLQVDQSRVFYSSPVLEGNSRVHTITLQHVGSPPTDTTFQVVDLEAILVTEEAPSSSLTVDVSSTGSIIAPLPPILSTSSSLTSSSASSAAAVPVQPESDSSDDFSGGPLIGIVVGSIAGAATLLAALILLARSRRSKRSPAPSPSMATVVRRHTFLGSELSFASPDLPPMAAAAASPSSTIRSIPDRHPYAITAAPAHSRLGRDGTFRRSAMLDPYEAPSPLRVRNPDAFPHDLRLSEVGVAISTPTLVTDHEMRRSQYGVLETISSTTTPSSDDSVSPPLTSIPIPPVPAMWMADRPPIRPSRSDMSLGTPMEIQSVQFGSSEDGHSQSATGHQPEPLRVRESYF